ncbi:MAG TPA: type IV toxin-antitoxin system AbiEi family antitoxin domain-containing protein [Solirubrobacterales bacterium]
MKPLDDRLAVGKSTLTSRELREELGVSPQAASNLLARWRRDGLVDRVARGRYAIRQIGLLGTRAASEDVALAIAALLGSEPHRIAYQSALDFHGLLTRPVRTIQVAVPRRVTAATVSGRPLEAIFEHPDTIEIGAEPAGHGAFVSGLERALIDAASRPDLVGGYFPLAEALVAANPDPTRLTDLAEELRAAAALRRIDSLADRLGLAGPSGKPALPQAADLRPQPRPGTQGTQCRLPRCRLAGALADPSPNTCRRAGPVIHPNLIKRRADEDRLSAGRTHRLPAGPLARLRAQGTSPRP